jgi:hypothetical protein
MLSHGAHRLKGAVRNNDMQINVRVLVLDFLCQRPRQVDRFYSVEQPRLATALASTSERTVADLMRLIYLIIRPMEYLEAAFSGPHSGILGIIKSVASDERDV